jgi:hypothetical protein
MVADSVKIIDASLAFGTRLRSGTSQGSVNRYPGMSKHEDRPRALHLLSPTGRRAIMLVGARYRLHASAIAETSGNEGRGET